MQLNSTEISELIKKRIAQFEVVSEARNTGTIVSVSDGIIRIHGLTEVMQGEMIALPDNRYAIALNLERDSVGAVVMGPYADLAEGMMKLKSEYDFRIFGGCCGTDDTHMEEIAKSISCGALS